MHYRLYFLDHDNKIADAVDLDCETDEQAIAAAREKTNGRRIEIWQRRRRVGVFDPSEPVIGN